jgi:hypothetical protein
VSDQDRARAIAERQQKLINAVGDAANNLALDGQRELAANLRIAASELFAAIHLALAVPPVPSAGWQKLFDQPPNANEDVLLICAKNGYRKIGQWRDWRIYNTPEFTHWMPLPSPPQEPT